MPEGIVCFLLCFGSIGGPTAPVNSYCQRYERTVRTKAEAIEIMKLPRSMRDRVQGNDLDYLCNCLGWKDAACQRVQKRVPVPK